MKKRKSAQSDWEISEADFSKNQESQIVDENTLVNDDTEKDHSKTLQKSIILEKSVKELNDESPIEQNISVDSLDTSRVSEPRGKSNMDKMSEMLQRKHEEEENRRAQKGYFISNF